MIASSFFHGLVTPNSIRCKFGLMTIRRVLPKRGIWLFSRCGAWPHWYWYNFDLWPHDQHKLKPNDTYSYPDWPYKTDVALPLMQFPLCWMYGSDIIFTPFHLWPLTFDPNNPKYFTQIPVTLKDMLMRYLHPRARTFIKIQ